MSYKDYNVHGKYDDRFEQYHDNGKLYQRGTFKNGKKHGDFIEFFDNGIMSLKCTFVDGVEEGPFEQYNEDGTLEYKGVFKNGEIVHLRPSGNAPEFRCYAEAKSEERAVELTQKVLLRLKEL